MAAPMAGHPGCVVVLGDSVAQGCADPDPAGEWLGWAGRLARRLGLPRERVANLAERGASLTDLPTAQLPAARLLRPAAALVNCGMNDALHGFDPGRLDGALDQLFRWLKGTAQGTPSATASDTPYGAPPVTGKGTPGPMENTTEASPPMVAIVAAVPVPPLLERSIFSDFRRGRTKQRIAYVNDRLRGLATESGALFMGGDAMPDIENPALWDADGIHLNPVGHAYIADTIVTIAGEVLGVQPVSTS